MARLRLGAARALTARLDASLYIRQSIRSDYCAVYATAMYLSLLGRRTGKAEALRMFSVQRPWRGASRQQMRQVVERHVPGLDMAWRHLRRPTPDRLARAFAQGLQRGRPLLVTAYCHHRRLGLSCGHVFLVTGMDGPDFLLLDPLCRAPTEGTCYNACLSRHRAPADTRAWPVSGSAWDLVFARGVAMLGPVGPQLVENRGLRPFTFP